MNDAAFDTLAARFDLVTRSIQLGAHSLEILHPRSVDDLIDDADFEADGRLPYWAAIWPSSTVLGEHLLKSPGAGRRLLELGCGIGVVSLAAALAGYQVVASDYHDCALDFIAANARHNGLSERISTRLLDWRALPDDLEQFDVIAAADVLYERQLSPLVAGVIDRCLTSNGVAWVTDPCRRAALDFPGECDARALECSGISQTRVVDGTAHPRVELLEIVRRRQ